MTKSTFGDLSTSQSANTSIDGNDSSENCVMSGLNNIDRALAAMGKSLGTFVTTTGTDTYTATFAPIPDALATDFFYGVNFASTNTSTTPTFNPSGLGPKTITRTDGSAVLVGDLSGRHILIYDGTNFRVLNPRGGVTDATNGGLTVTGGTAALNVSDLSAATPTQASTLAFEAGSGTKKATLAGASNSLVNIAASTKSQMQAATDATTIVTPSQVQNHPGTAKAWVNYSNNGTITVNGSYNVSGVVRNSQGVVTVSFTTAFADTHYAIAGMLNSSSGGIKATTLNTGSCQFNTYDLSNSNLDAGAFIAFFGAQ